MINIKKSSLVTKITNFNLRNAWHELIYPAKKEVSDLNLKPDLSQGLEGEPAKVEPLTPKPSNFPKKFIFIAIAIAVVVLSFVLYFALTRDRDKAPEPGSKIITIEEVALHNTADDCWVLVDNLVFDVTSVEDHLTPFTCGSDMSVEYHEQHGKGISDNLLPYEVGGLMAGRGVETVEIDMRVFQFGFVPDVIEVVEGTKVIINFTEVSSYEEAGFLKHTFTIGPPYNINEILDVGETYRIEFVADVPGEYIFECVIYCGTRHPEMKGKLIVTPKGESDVVVEDFYHLETIKDNLRVFYQESELADEPIWDKEDFLYLMAVVQAEYQSGAIGIINTRTLENLGDVRGVGNRVHVMEFHPNRRWLYSVSRNGLVSKIDLYTMRVVRQVKIGLDSRGMAFSHDGRYIIAGNYAPFTAVVLDSETLEPLQIIETKGVDPDGNLVDSRVAGMFGVDNKELFAINLKEAGQVWFIEQKPPFGVVKTIKSGRVLHEINAINIGETLLAITSQKDNSYSLIDVNLLETVKTIPAPDTPHPGEGIVDYKNNLWLANSIEEAKVTVIDTEKNEATAFLWPDNIDISEGGGLFGSPIPPGDSDVEYFIFDIVFGNNKGAVYVVDREAVARGEEGTSPVVGMYTWEDFGFEEQGRIIGPEYSYDGKYVLLSGWDYDKVIVLDAEALPDLKIVKEFDLVTPTGIFPSWGVEAEYLH